MKAYVNWIKNAPFIIKLILALPGLDFLYGLYRLFNKHVIAGLIWLFAGWSILWIIDLLSVIFSGRITLFAD